jgi:hypothetical protein
VKLVEVLHRSRMIEVLVMSQKKELRGRLDLALVIEVMPK